MCALLLVVKILQLFLVEAETQAVSPVLYYKFTFRVNLFFDIFVRHNLISFDSGPHRKNIKDRPRLARTAAYLVGRHAPPRWLLCVFFGLNDDPSIARSSGDRTKISPQIGISLHFKRRDFHFFDGQEVIIVVFHGAPRLSGGALSDQH